MKINLGGFILLVALSSAAMMLGYTKYAPQPPRAPVTPAVRPSDHDESDTPRSRSREELKRPERPSVDVEARPDAKPEVSRQVTVYAVRAAGEDLKLVPIREKVAEATPLAALKALAAYDGPDESVLPKGTKVLGVKVGESGLAEANFSHELVDNFPGGSATEGRVLGAIVNTLTQFRSVDRVVIKVDGKPVDSIGGHIELDEPLTRAMALESGGGEM